MSLLFARYVAGQIADPAWSQIMAILDAEDTSMDERVALANFISDAFQDLGPDDVKVPPSNEVRDFVTLTRAA
jgi:hypothetical protein